MFSKLSRSTVKSTLTGLGICSVKESYGRRTADFRHIGGMDSSLEKEKTNISTYFKKDFPSPSHVFDSMQLYKWRKDNVNSLTKMRQRHMFLEGSSKPGSERATHMR